MNGRLTVGALKDSFNPGVLGLCLPSDNTQYMSWLNEAQSRLLAYGRWWGSIVEAKFCVRNGCLVWPRQVATIEQVAVCNQPITIHNAWYEFTETLARIESCDSCNCGTGSNQCNQFLGSCSCGHFQMRMRAENRAAYELTRGANKVLRFYPTHSDDVGKKILVHGYDENRIWVRTVVDGAVTDGEEVTLALPYVDTVTTWFPGSPTAIQKEVTDYRVLLYEYDTVDDESRFLSTYEPGEEFPQYRVSFIPGFNRFCCNRSNEDCDEEQQVEDDDDCTRRRTVTALVKLAHIKLTSDRDWLLFQNAAAYKEAMLAVKYWEENDFVNGNLRFYGVAQPKQARASNQATLSKGGAIPMLRAELRSMTGDITEVYTHYEADNRFPATMGGFW